MPAQPQHLINNKGIESKTNINKIQHVVTKTEIYFKEYCPVKNSQFKEFQSNLP